MAAFHKSCAGSEARSFRSGCVTTTASTSGNLDSSTPCSPPPKSVNLSRSIGLQRLASRHPIQVRMNTAILTANTVLQTFSQEVLHLHSLEELEQLVLANSDKLVVLDCSTKLCGPCRMMDPIFTSHAQHFKDAIFVRIDTEENKSTKAIMTTLSVRALPAFFAWRDEKLVGQCRGAQQSVLRKIIVDNVRQAEAGYVLPCFRPKKATISGGGPRSLYAGLQKPIGDWGGNAAPSGA